MNRIADKSDHSSCDIRAYRSGPRAIWSENVMAWGTAQNEVVLPQLTLG